MNNKTIARLSCLVAAIAMSLSLRAQLVDLNQDFKYFGCVGDVKAKDNINSLPSYDDSADRPARENFADRYLSYALLDIEPLEIEYSNGQLTMTKYVPQDCFDNSITAYVKKSENIIWFHTQTFMIANTGENCECTKMVSSTVSDIAPGNYYIIASDAVYRVDLTEKLSMKLSGEDMLLEPYSLRDDAEWVYYREGEDHENPLFVRMRMTKPKNGPASYDERYKKFELYYCEGEYDQKNAVKVSEAELATPSSLGLNVIPLEHPLASGEGSYSVISDEPGSWQNPASCLGISPYYNFNSTPSMVWDFAKWWAQYPQIVDIKETKVDGKPSLHYFFNNGLQLVYGVGPVGADYASNFCYPAFQLPEGVAPLRFLYMRSLVDDHIIYGDPSLDPSYKGSTQLTEANDNAWIENAVEFGIVADGEAEVRAYSLSGQEVASQKGFGRVTIERSQLDAGIYLVVASADCLHLTRKVVN